MSELSTAELAVLERAQTDYLLVALLYMRDGKLTEPDVPEYKRRLCAFAPSREDGSIRNTQEEHWHRRPIKGWFKRVAEIPPITHFGVALPCSGMIFVTGPLATDTGEALVWSETLRLERGALALKGTDL